MDIRLISCIKIVERELKRQTVDTQKNEQINEHKEVL